MQNKFILAVDFDNTIAERSNNDVPKILIKDADAVINYLSGIGCYIIIWTCRPKDQLKLVSNFLKDHKIKYDAINKNAPWITFTDSPKIFYNALIDDRALLDINWKEIKEKVKKSIAKEKAKNLAKEILDEKR